MVWACAAKLRIEDTDWVKKCMEYEVEGDGSGGRPKKTWSGSLHVLLCVQSQLLTSTIT